MNKLLIIFLLVTVVLFTACQENPKPKVIKTNTLPIKETIKYKVPTVIKVGESTYSVTVDSFFKLGDAESILTAKKIALETAKQESSSIIGSYVESELQLINGKLTVDEIKIFTASVMSSKINKEERLFKDGASTLKLNVTSIIDEKVLKQKINDLNKRSKSKQEIIKLGKENNNLLNKIQKLSNEIKNKNKNKKTIPL